MDMAMEGYCLGVSSVNAFSRMPNSKNSAVFGKEVAHDFEVGPAQDEDAALRLLRLFAILQMNPKFQAMTRELPEIPTRETLEANQRLLTFKSASLLQDLPAAQKRSAEVIKQNADFLQTPKGKNEGLFANLIVARKGPTLLGRHSVYVLSGERAGEKYRFQYLDPNHPGEIDSFEYDPATNGVKFSTDSQNAYSILTEFYDLDTAYRTYAEVIQDMAKVRGDANNATLSFLRLPGSDPQFDELFRTHSLGEDPALFAKWYKKVSSLSEDASKHDAAAWESNRNHPKEVEEQRRQAAEGSANRAKSEAEAMAAYLSLSFAAQTQLDLGCENFKVFMGRVLAPLMDAEFVSPQLLRNYTGSTRGFGADLPVASGTAAILIQKVLKWAQLANNDGKREGRPPQKNLEQAACIKDVIMPYIAQQVATKNTMAWGFLLDKTYVDWLLGHYDFTAHQEPNESLMDGNIAHLNPDILFQRAILMSLADNPQLKANGLALLKRIEKLHARVRTEWAQDIAEKKLSTKFPEAAAHRSQWLWEAFLVPLGQDSHGNPMPWTGKKLPSETDEVLKRMKKEWDTFFKKNKIMPFIQDASEADYKRDVREKVHDSSSEN